MSQRVRPAKAELKQLHELKMANVDLSEYSARMVGWRFAWKEVREPEPYVEPDDQVLSAPILGSTIAMDNHWPNNPAKRRKE